jgi:hypothetical protein
MDVALIVAGVLGCVAALVHGAGGEVLVVRKLSPDTLPASRFGGPRMTRTMIRASWHMTTVAFLTVAGALLVSGSIADGDAAEGIALVGAAASTGLAGVALASSSSLASIVRHPAPLLLSAMAALAWAGALAA